jgi:aryl-alcohol dehydrogenase-like predicted oxidoreductase
MGGAPTGKYNEGIPAGSRMDVNKEFFKDSVARMHTEEGRKEIEKVKQLTKLAEDKLGCSVGQLALAWAASNGHVSTVILGATKPEQLKENFGALKVSPLFSMHNNCLCDLARGPPSCPVLPNYSTCF